MRLQLRLEEGVPQEDVLVPVAVDACSCFEAEELSFLDECKEASLALTAALPFSRTASSVSGL